MVSMDELSNVLEDAKVAKEDYLTRKRDLKDEKARLWLETDWGKEFPDKNRVTEADKKEFIRLAVSDLQEDCDKAEVWYYYCNELLSISKILAKE